MNTKEYIEKVTKADEIQNLCKHNKGDWFWNGEKPYLYCKSGLGSSNPYDYKWLPTLEDLFELTKFLVMPKEYLKYDSFIAKGIYGWGKDYKELLLEYIMKEFYNKFWNPEKKEWEVIN
jgi:hypothetical protein